MESAKYQPLQQSLHEGEEKKSQQVQITSSRSWTVYALAVLLALSVVLNASILLRPTIQALPETPYAHLQRNVPVKWSRHDPWDSANRTEEDAAWSEPPGFNVREAIVALPDAFTESVGLPSAQRWPWDNSRGVYFLEGLHNLHCVKYLRKTVYEVEEGRPVSTSFRHLKHCINGLRQFVMCNADDTPRYTGRLHDQAKEAEPFGGVGQTRMCRNWDQYMDWVTKNSACYRWVPDDTEGFMEADRYKSCPDGQVYWK